MKTLAACAAPSVWLLYETPASYPQSSTCESWGCPCKPNHEQALSLSFGRVNCFQRHFDFQGSIHVVRNQRHFDFQGSIHVVRSWFAKYILLTEDMAFDVITPCLAVAGVSRLDYGHRQCHGNCHNQVIPPPCGKNVVILP